MTAFSERRHPGEILLSEAAGKRAREGTTVAPSQSFAAGAVLALLALVESASVNAAAGAANVGDGALTPSDPPVSTKARRGVYRATATGATTFAVEDPAGVIIGIAAVGEPFDGELRFTIAAGAEPFQAGDTFEITIDVAHQSAAFDPTATDGRERPGAIALAGATTGADETARITALIAHCEVNGAALVWPEAITAHERAVAIGALRALGIVVR
ncbi:MULTISPECIES: head decoration protein [unclassified Chelatococcus]|uniref:head decoration protein n=1 Tax=unclassified Chelatococcus TaxID=2638111 RepID=UPI000320081A|nr:MULTISPECIES: head decoration protein [unclassified Chelatococcus]